MAKRIIVLGIEQGGYGTLRVCYWMAVPTSRQKFYADPNKMSAYLDADLTELTALQNGQIVEVVETLSFTPGMNISQARTLVQARWVALQNGINNAIPEGYGPGYGTSWDGTSWSN